MVKALENKSLIVTDKWVDNTYYMKSLNCFIFSDDYGILYKVSKDNSKSCKV